MRESIQRRYLISLKDHYFIFKRDIQPTNVVLFQLLNVEIDIYLYVSYSLGIFMSQVFFENLYKFVFKLIFVNVSPFRPFI